MYRNSLGESSEALEVDGTACIKSLRQEAAWFICVTHAGRATVGNMVFAKMDEI